MQTDTTNATREDAALVRLGRHLQRVGYAFTTITPESHARINRRPGNAVARTVEDVLGWSRPFHPAPPLAELAALLAEAGALRHEGDALRSTIRVSTLDGRLFVHSAFPTVQADAVFFGPDTYRFARLLRTVVGGGRRFGTVVDIGCGSGAGGILVGAWLGAAGPAPRLVLGDINALALRYSAVNAALAGLAEVDVRHSDVLAGVDGAIDLVIANPPYLKDAAGRRYRHGGERLGTDLSLRMAEESLARLAPGGRLVLYTGAPVVGGRDLLRADLLPVVEKRAASYRYEEIDPDVFGEELDTPAYSQCDRIAVVALIADVP